MCGILLQHPVPAHIDERACFDAISLEKDVDGVTTAGFGRAAMGAGRLFAAPLRLRLYPLLKRYNIPLEGREAVVIGRSPILGKPVARCCLMKTPPLP